MDPQMAPSAHLPPGKSSFPSYQGSFAPQTPAVKTVIKPKFVREAGFHTPRLLPVWLHLSSLGSCAHTILPRPPVWRQNSH